MTLRHLRHALLLRIRHPIGRLMGALLLVALVVVGAPITTLHAHQGGGRDHSHDAGASVVVDSDQDHGGHDQHDGAPDPKVTLPLDTVLHQHDVGTLVSTVSAVPALALPELMLGAFDAELPATSPPTTDSTPPQRPPIA